MNNSPEKYLADGYIKRIHVDQNIIRSNFKHGKSDPPLTIQTSNGSLKANEIMVHGPTKIVHRPHDPLSCGARVWIETTAEVTLE